MKTTVKAKKGGGYRTTHQGGLGLELGLSPNRVAQVRRAQQTGRMDAFLAANPQLNARIQNRASGATGTARTQTNANALMQEAAMPATRQATPRRQGLDALFPATPWGGSRASDRVTAQRLYTAARRGRLQGGEDGLTVRTARPGVQTVTNFRGGPVDIQDPAVQALLASSAQRRGFGLGLGFDAGQREAVRGAAGAEDYGTLGTLLAPALERVGRNSWRAQALAAQLGIDPALLRTFR